jgi:hypothetical protein
LFRAQLPVAAAGTKRRDVLGSPTPILYSIVQNHPNTFFLEPAKSEFPSTRRHTLKKTVVRGDERDFFVATPLSRYLGGQLDADCATSDDNNVLCGNQRGMSSFNLHSTFLRA